MAGRAYWDGHVRLSLITFPVRLYPAITDAEKIMLHKIRRSTGERIHYQNITDDQKVVPPKDIVKGYEYEKGQYVPIEDDELKALQAQSEHTIDLVQFADLDDIDPIYFDRPYFMAPEGKVAQEAFITIRDALRASKKVALGQITMAQRERIAAIKPCGKGMILETLRYNREIRKQSEYFDDIPDAKKVSKEQVELAEELIKKKSGAFDPASFKDSYQEGLLEIVNAKLHDRKPKLKAPAREPGKVINIMDALKRSLGEDSARKPPKKASKKSTAKPIKKKRKAG